MSDKSRKIVRSPEVAALIGSIKGWVEFFEWQAQFEANDNGFSGEMKDESMAKAIREIGKDYAKLAKLMAPEWLFFEYKEKGGV